MPDQPIRSTMEFPERSHSTTDKLFTWDEVRALLDKESMRRAEYLARILESLRKHYGDQVLEIASRVIYDLGYEKGQARARLVQQAGDETDLPSLAKLVSHDMARLYLGNSADVTADPMLIRETYCPLPRKWREIGMDDETIVAYCHLFDQVDKGMVEGYNPSFEAALSGCTGLAQNGFCQMVVRKK
jgi:hypothetical protein